jgi:hypothetical protein
MGLAIESAEVKDEEEDMLLIEGPCLCLFRRDSAGARARILRLVAVEVWP